MKDLPKSYKKGANTSGFTLIELLVVIGVLTVLLSIVLIAINPSRQFSQANNTQRRSDVNAILNAIHQYSADNNGSIPSGITNTATNMGSGASDIDICSDLVPTYIAEMPVDPTGGSWTDCSTYDTDYTVLTTGSSGRVTVASPTAELSATIQVTR
jgi:prepilin-type N-terminal cleavage/methylation domain-containing protein